jgi:hypothetical protein
MSDNILNNKKYRRIKIDMVRGSPCHGCKYTEESKLMPEFPKFLIEDCERCPFLKDYQSYIKTSEGQMHNSPGDSTRDIRCVTLSY